MSIERKNILIGISGIFSLLCSAAFINKSKLAESNVFVFDYLSGSQGMIEGEKWICRLLGYEYLGRIESVEYSSNRIAGTGRLSRLLNIPFFGKRLKEWVDATFSEISAEDLSELVLPFRTTIAEALLASSFPQAKLHFVSDGFLVAHRRRFRLTLPWRLRGLSNPYSSRPIIWVPPGLEEALSEFSRCSVIEGDFFSDIYRVIWNDVEFQNWLGDSFPTLDRHSYTFFPLQNLDARGFADSSGEISLYGKIIKNELGKSNNRIIVKPHPRDGEAKLEALKSSLDEDTKKRVVFMGFNPFATFPLEIFLENMPIDRLVGQCSTVLLTAGKKSRTSVSLYCSPSLPRIIIEETKRMAEAGDIEIINV